ncbi:MAG TPA: anti-sigma factor [Acidimicrobiia bacterium]|nr:anti-sigma factor [Acidimicrobiia bacterium]
MSSAEMHDLVALYALDALEGEERRDFESHLEACAECGSSLAEYRSAAGSLVPDAPASDATWQRISSAIAGTDAATDQPGEVVPIRRATSDTVWKTVAGIAAAAALVFAAVALLDGGAEPLSSEGIVAAAEDVAAEPGTFVGEFLVDDVSVGQVVLSADGRGFVIPTEQLEPLGSDRTYQLWVINEAEDVISAGVLGNDPAPATFTWTGDTTGFALTREVAGGVISSAGDVVSVITGA